MVALLLAFGTVALVAAYVTFLLHQLKRLGPLDAGIQATIERGGYRLVVASAGVLAAFVVLFLTFLIAGRWLFDALR